MRLKTLRITIAALAAVAVIPVVTPAQARVMLTFCERMAWADCEAEFGAGRINDPEFAACFEAQQKVYCPPPEEPPFPGPILDCTKDFTDPRCPPIMVPW